MLTLKKDRAALEALRNNPSDLQQMRDIADRYIAYVEQLVNIAKDKNLIEGKRAMAIYQSIRQIVDESS